MRMSELFTVIATIAITFAALYFWYVGNTLLTLVALLGVPAPLLASIIENRPWDKKPNKDKE